ncbi:hypothetical protein [Paenibacillus mesotrionivorans]|uniref:Uncharacterized protein n=1 Tax=Paenibacillus mesotrionivorans TaxID=3160968 RepID=A0ACC7NWQ7_9BACL
MFEKLTKRFDQVTKALNRITKLELTGELTKLKVPEEFLKLKMIGELTELKIAEDLLKLELTGELTELSTPDKLLKLKLSGELKDLKVPDRLLEQVTEKKNGKADKSKGGKNGRNSRGKKSAPSIGEKLKSALDASFIKLTFPIWELQEQLNKSLGKLKISDTISKIVPPKIKNAFSNFKMGSESNASKRLNSEKNKGSQSKRKKATGSKFSSKSNPNDKPGILSRFGSSMKESWQKNSSNKLKMPGFMNLDNAKSVISSTMGAGMKQQQTKGAFIARAGNAQLGGAIYDKVAKQALQYGQKPEDALSSALSFTNTTMDPSKIAEMNKLAMRLAQMNPEKGLDGAASSMMDLFKGESSSMVDDFGMGESSVEASAALKAGKAGDIDGFIKGMDELLNKRNMTEQAFEGMMKSPAAQWEKAVNSFQFSLGLVGQMGLEAFGPLISMITEAFDSGKFTPFFTFFGKGLYVIVTLVSWLAEGFMGVLGFLGANLPLIAGLIASGLVVALWNVLPPLFAMIPPILTQAGAWFMANLPIFLIIGAIALLLFILIKLGVSAGQIVGFITGVFYTFFAYIKNSVAYFWNILISLKEFLLNVFKDPVYAIKKLVYDLAQNVAGFFGSVINGIVDKLNVLLKAAEKIGIKVPLIPEVEVDKWLEELKPTTTKDVVDLSNEKMQFENLADAFDNGFNKGEKLMDGLRSMKNPFNLDSKYGDAIPPIDNIKKVEEVGSINDTVEVSGEDLATMRELAEMKNIQNFVQMTPSVNVQTGDIRQESDINSIVARIEQVLTEQIVSSAQGVYGT